MGVPVAPGATGVWTGGGTTRSTSSSPLLASAFLACARVCKAFISCWSIWMRCSSVNVNVRSGSGAEVVLGGDAKVVGCGGAKVVDGAVGRTSTNNCVTANCPGFCSCHLLKRSRRLLPIMAFGIYAPDGRTTRPSMLRLHFPACISSKTLPQSLMKWPSSPQYPQLSLRGLLGGFVSVLAFCEANIFMNSVMVPTKAAIPGSGLISIVGGAALAADGLAGASVLLNILLEPASANSAAS